MTTNEEAFKAFFDYGTINKKGEIGENKMKDWLDDNKLRYVYINQSPETFSIMFPDKIKRPDFLILIDSIGLIAVDVKNYKRKNDYFTLNYEKELTKVLAFERHFRMPVWYAYTDTDSHETDWYWISALKAAEVGTMSQNSKNNEIYLKIKTSDFTTISVNEDLGKLYTQRF
jgi:hypothetical protein